MQHFVARKIIDIKYTNLLKIKNKSKLSRKIHNLSYKHQVGSEPLRPITLGQLLEETSHKYGDNFAVISCHQNKKNTFREVLEQADRLAAGLAKIGVEFGDRVGLWAPNLLEWYVANMACARGGYIMVALNPSYQPKEVKYCIEKVGIKSIICAHKFKTQDYYEILKSLCPELSESNPGKIKSSILPSLKSAVIISDEKLSGTYSYEELLNLDINGTDAIRKKQKFIKFDDACNIQFTSGTTGNPKAAVISHFNIVNNGFYVGKRNELDRKHHTICIQVPLFHAIGTVISIAASLNYGSTLVLPSSNYSPEKNLDAIKNENCTIIYGTPTMYVDLISSQNRRKENLNAEIAVAGGAPCSPKLFKDMLEVLKLKKVKSMYGLTETTAVVFQSCIEDDEDKSTLTVGHVQEHTEVKVIDENGYIVPFGTPGELCLRSPYTMLGYWKDEQKTREIIESNGWMHTGDKFILTSDGYGKVIGRLKDMIIRGGENIFPKEIEDHLNTHPDILESQVIGLPHERLGEEVCACIRLKDGSTVSHEDIKNFCKGILSHFKIPSVVKVVTTFPKTTSGKIQKFKLVQQIYSIK